MDKKLIQTVPEFFQNYINIVPDGNMLTTYKNQSSALIDFYSSINESKSLYRYSEGKWSIRELIGHMCDTERIFTYRALRIARNDQTPLSGFDENVYVENANFDSLPFSTLLKHYINIRNSNYDLFSSFSEIDFTKTGIVEGNKINIVTILGILIGHSEHHKRVVKERYL